MKHPKKIDVGIDIIANIIFTPGALYKLPEGFAVIAKDINHVGDVGIVENDDVLLCLGYGPTKVCRLKHIYDCNSPKTLFLWNKKIITVCSFFGDKKEYIKLS